MAICFSKYYPQWKNWRLFCYKIKDQFNLKPILNRVVKLIRCMWLQCPGRKYNSKWTLKTLLFIVASNSDPICGESPTLLTSKCGKTWISKITVFSTTTHHNSQLTYKSQFVYSYWYWVPTLLQVQRLYRVNRPYSNHTIDSRSTYTLYMPYTV